MTVIDKNYKHSIAELPNFLKIKKRYFRRNGLLQTLFLRNTQNFLVRLLRIENELKNYLLYFQVELNFREIPIKHLKLVDGIYTVPRQRLTHFVCAQIFKNVSIFGEGLYP